MIDYELVEKLRSSGESLSQIAKKHYPKISYGTFRKAVYRHSLWRPGGRVDDDLRDKVETHSHTHYIDIDRPLEQRTLCFDKTRFPVMNAGVPFKDIKAKYMEDPAVKKEYDALAPEYEISPRTIKFGVVSDTHIGSIYTQMTFLRDVYKRFKQEGIERVFHVGDISEGQYTNRAEHIYECFAHGADQQSDYIIENYPQEKGMTTEFITGNHDFTFKRNAGVDIGRMIAAKRPDMIYLGKDRARIHLTPNCTVDLNHPGDGAAYSVSYSLQKHIESFADDDKPSIALQGHHHKFAQVYFRNVFGFECGTTQSQSGFMRSKRLAAHMVALIITVKVDDEGKILSLTNEIIPLNKVLKNDY